jgi:hypothetical protein
MNNMTVHNAHIEIPINIILDEHGMKEILRNSFFTEKDEDIEALTKERIAFRISNTSFDYCIFNSLFTSPDWEQCFLTFDNEKNNYYVHK